MWTIVGAILFVFIGIPIIIAVIGRLVYELLRLLEGGYLALVRMKEIVLRLFGQKVSSDGTIEAKERLFPEIDQ